MLRTTVNCIDHVEDPQKFGGLQHSARFYRICSKATRIGINLFKSHPYFCQYDKVIDCNGHIFVIWTAENVQRDILLRSINLLLPIMHHERRRFKTFQNICAILVFWFVYRGGKKKAGRVGATVRKIRRFLKTMFSFSTLRPSKEFIFNQNLNCMLFRCFRI